MKYLFYIVLVIVIVYILALIIFAVTAKAMSVKMNKSKITTVGDMEQIQPMEKTTPLENNLLTKIKKNK